MSLTAKERRVIRSGAPWTREDLPDLSRLTPAAWEAVCAALNAIADEPESLARAKEALLRVARATPLTSVDRVILLANAYRDEYRAAWRKR